MLFPVFAHCFLALVGAGRAGDAAVFWSRFAGEHAPSRAQQLHELAGLAEPAHIVASPAAQGLLQARSGVRLSGASVELLLAYANARAAAASPLLLTLLNEHVRLQRTGASPTAGGGDAGDEAEEEALAGGGADAQAASRHKGAWGVLSSSLLLAASRPELPSAEAAAAGQGGDASCVPPPPGLRVVDSSLPPGALPPFPAAAEVAVLRDLRRRARLGPSSLPSVVCLTLAHARGRAVSAAPSSDGSRLAVGFDDASVRLWDVAAAAEGRAAWRRAHNPQHPPPTAPPNHTPAKLIGHGGPVYCCAWSACDAYVLSGSGDGTLRLWSSELSLDGGTPGFPLAVYSGHHYPIWCLSPSPVGHYFVSGGADRTARLWALDSPHPRRVFVGHASDVESVAWHPSCNYVATGSGERTARLWDVASGECVRLLAGATAPVCVVSFSPDGTQLAGATADGGVLLWDLATGRRVASAPAAHAGPVHALAWSVEGSLLASGGADGALKLWAPGLGATGAPPPPTPAHGLGLSPSPVPRLFEAKELRTKGAALLGLRFSGRNLLFAVAVK